MIERVLRDKGFTDKQIEAGIKYYVNFCKRFDINIAKSIDMIVRMIENMRSRYEKA